ncbi:transcription antitermination regulator [Streptomyces sp. NRRL F-5755]|uniref:ANTAR domain-containing protein n=1 Tax=Streptomyces sp. NRRL F-5755 TaxID=1519475 RepID=UPI0006AF50BC|nr:ANTAR domain-containing protein [Streptomyces sp. NRRL F-5755]KOT95787.1 transcription antitermination regulator [Streptomyces sp. NRRL F-5755]
MTTTTREVLIAHGVLDLARRRAGFDPLELLHDLTAQAVALLPVRSAGITVLKPDGTSVVYVTASDELCLALEEDQSELNEGPCLDSARSRRPLPVLSLSEPPGSIRWPRFAPRARRAGITAVAAVNLHLPQLSLGALNLLMAGPPYPGGQDLRLAQTLADAAGAALAFRQELADKDQVLDQLQTALDSRLVIEQAKGVLSARLGVGMDEAFQRLRAHARSRQQKLTDLSARITRGDVPADLLTPTR